MPRYVCGPAAKVELEFWGIPDTIIERCCYSHYNAFNSTLKALNRLEKDRHGSFDFPKSHMIHEIRQNGRNFRDMHYQFLNTQIHQHLQRYKYILVSRSK
jgi:hypothetical protein